jgi:mevalonate kinase
MDSNHALLIQLGVSSPTLDMLVDAAREAGALGAKLSGAGQGGNMLALVGAEDAENVAEVLAETGAAHVIRTTVT